MEDIPFESLLRCNLCRGKYDLINSFRLAKLLSFHVSTVTCPKCVQEIRLLILGRLPMYEDLASLFRLLPAPQLGMAMLIAQAEQQEQLYTAAWTKRREFLPNIREHCLLHAMPNSIWYQNCGLLTEASPESSSFSHVYYLVALNGMAPVISENWIGWEYKGWVIIHAWPNESIKAGEFEAQNGQGGRSAALQKLFQMVNQKFCANLKFPLQQIHSAN